MGELNKRYTRTGGNLGKVTVNTDNYSNSDYTPTRTIYKGKVTNYKSIYPPSNITTVTAATTLHSNKGMTSKVIGAAQQAATESNITAWQTTTTEINEGNWFNNLYKKIDYGLYGWLPGGLSRERVKAMDTEIINDDIILLNTANQTHADKRAETQEIKEQVKIRDDFNKKSWYEYLGIGYSQTEADYQNQMNKLREQNILLGLNSNIPRPRETNIIREFGNNLGSGFTQGITEKSSNWGNYALIGVAAILGVMVLRKK